MPKTKDQEPQVDVESLQADARKSAELELADTRKQLMEAFPDRPEFVLHQIELAHNVSEAKADLADILIAENKQLKIQGQAHRAEAEKQAADLTLARESETEAVGTGINVAFASVADIGPNEDSPIEERAEWDWQRDTDGCQSRYRSQKSYMAVRKAIDSGQLQVRGNTVVQLNG